MVKQDELVLMKRIRLFDGRIPTEQWGQLSKRDYYLLEKWAKKGFWEYGVSLRSGWLTDKGKAYFEEQSE